MNRGRKILLIIALALSIYLSTKYNIGLVLVVTISFLLGKLFNKKEIKKIKSFKSSGSYKKEDNNKIPKQWEDESMINKMAQNVKDGRKEMP